MWLARSTVAHPVGGPGGCVLGLVGQHARPSLHFGLGAKRSVKLGMCCDLLAGRCGRARLWVLDPRQHGVGLGPDGGWSLDVVATTFDVCEWGHTFVNTRHICRDRLAGSPAVGLVVVASGRPRRRCVGPAGQPVGVVDVGPATLCANSGFELADPRRLAECWVVEVGVKVQRQRKLGLR